MKLAELFQQVELPEPNFAQFLNRSRPHGMPPLATTELSLEALAGNDRGRIKTITNGTGTLVVKYKGVGGGG